MSIAQIYAQFLLIGPAPGLINIPEVNIVQIVGRKSRLGKISQIDCSDA